MRTLHNLATSTRQATTPAAVHAWRWELRAAFLLVGGLVAHALGG